MKAPIIALLVFILMLSSCKDSNTSQDNTNEDSFSEKDSTAKETDNSNTYSKDLPRDNEASESNNDLETSNTIKKTDNSNSEIQPSNLSGNFIKIGQEMDNSCACYCMNINTTGNSELCLTPSKIFINIRMANTNSQTTNIFFVNPSSKNTEGKDIPWNKFDKNTPIATITSMRDGEIELDWLGFSINGDLAIDYAILGKKTLEGSYKRK